MSSLDLHHMHIGGAQPLMTQDIIGGFEVSIPSLETQKKVTSILSSFDAKIELNRRINDNLTQAA
jgi:type I restriction enzyme S subunit